MDVQALQHALGHAFRSRDLLQQALTHRSHSVAHNERLEFLGDSVLNCVVASLLFEKFARIDEGDLSRLRANLVKQQSLYEIAQRLELSPYLRLGEGELKSGGFRRPSILADTVEALFGAIFLDAGFEVAERVIRKLYLPVMETVDPKTLGKDAKTLLQEYLQGRKIALPIYTVVATHGAAHSQEFEVECAVPKLAIQVLGAGGSRRAAEQAAAKKALEAAQALAVATTKRARRAKPAQLTLEVAVEQSAEPPAPPPAARRVTDAKVRDGDAAKAPAAKVGALEPARIVAAAPRAESTKTDASKTEQPKVDASKADASKVDVPKSDPRVGRPDGRTDSRGDAKPEARPDAAAVVAADGQGGADIATSDDAPSPSVDAAASGDASRVPTIRVA